MVSYDKLVTDGYYYGHVSEIFSDMSVFYDFHAEAKKLTKAKNNCVYVNDIKGHKSSYYARYINPDKVWIRRETLKRKNLFASQQWWSYTLQATVDPNVYERFKTALSNYMISIYAPAGLAADNIAHGDNVTLYETGDYSEIHNDGVNVGRYAVIIIYFGEDYKEDSGGEFIFGEDATIKVEPRLGNFVMLDFTKNNLAHGVLPVNNGFERLSYLDFVANLSHQ